MKVSELIKQLQAIKEKEGDIEVTMEATVLPEGYSSQGNASFSEVFESTVETLRVEKSSKEFPETRVRLYWQM